MLMHKQLAARVKAFRMKRGMSLEKFALFAGVAKRTVWRLEQGMAIWELKAAKIEKAIKS
jgi:transcriptional regulator with XRE-family HTH domain